MTDFKFFSKCFRCKKKRLYIAKREVRTPLVSLTAKSREMFCNKCAKDIKSLLESKI